MANQTLALWDEVELQMPARSRLYHLKLEGQGQHQQEALLGYVHRVAHAHTLSITTLLKAEVFGRTDIRTAPFATGFAKKYSKTVNGYGKYAEQMSRVMGDLTLNSDLRSGTFLWWGELFDGKGTGVLHPKRRWCADCFHEDRDLGLPLFQRLVWSSYSVSHCPKHWTPLSSECPACGKEQHFISDAVALGRCCHCGGFLGTKEGLWDCPTPTAREKFMTESIARMVSMGPAAASLASLEGFVAQLKAFSSRIVGGRIPKLEREIGFRKASLSNWTNEGHRPQFDQFMELCFRIDVSPVELLDGSWSRSVEARAIQRMPVPVRRHHKVLSEAELAALRSDVECLVQLESEYEDAVSVAARHGITMASFKNRYGDLYKKVSEHRTRTRALMRAQRIERQREMTLEVVRQLHRDSARLSRAMIETGMRAAGMTLADPGLRSVAFAERARLEGAKKG